MKKLGQWQELELLRFTSVGAYLNALDETSDTDVLLPSNELSEDLELGQMLSVFLYRDSEDRMIATLKRPYAILGDIALLEVLDIAEIGTFLDWGLTKDLLLPQGEQKAKLKVGDKVLVYLYLDASDRLAATMKIEKHLIEKSPYKIGDTVNGTVYSIAKDIGVFVAVDNRYYGLLPERERVDDYHLGDKVEARVTLVQPDGKLSLATRAKVSQQIHTDVALIKEKLVNANGFLPFNDKTAPELIKKEFKMSKKAFKRAVGVLLKEGSIEFANNGIKKR